MIEKFRGALIGFAIGDALGMPVEGMSKEEIERVFGRVEEFMPSPYGDLKAGEWTDDTEQMIILAKSILRTVYFSPDDFSERLKFITSNRIGPTTRVALNNLAFGVPWNKSGVESETCGSAVRVLPIGLIYAFSLDLVEKYAIFSSVVTHRGAAVAGAVAIAVAVACILNEWKEDELIDEVVKRTGKFNEHLADKILLADQISDKDLNSAVEIIENSMSVYDSVPLSFYCYLSSSSFKECALKAVNAGGDTDSIAAMACGMKGCKLGIDSIPAEWIWGLKDYERIMDLADRLHDLHLMISNIR